MTIYFPSLSEDGWVTNSLLQADYLFSHFFVAEYSQTQLYLGQVASLPWIIQKGNNNMPETVRIMQNTLATYFGRYYQDVVVEVTEKTKGDPSSKAELLIYVRFIDHTGEEVVLGKLAELVDLKVNKIISISNG